MRATRVPRALLGRRGRSRSARRNAHRGPRSREGKGKMVARPIAAVCRPRLSVDAKSSSTRAGLARADLGVSEVVAHHLRLVPARSGFISIDCGIPENSSYQDLRSSMIYVSDYGFISSGANHNISPEYIKPSLAQRNYNVRFFPDGTRNCYTLRSLVAGNKYFVRADFYYGN
ncbi:hypothetical protein PR202_gb06241 [Eleusine coracana subsp. coracana]|uniref:Malectin-like domain-containing protein n=1 Tax=Eleusine coracana subsp. coracana TaxID=191504 RepID=A0AAV5E7C7_ELECO|nr:hypothetical protein PR202_gb06241 [Eleusine coracana subsp. coracana]